jgi:hypothetical protein
MYIYGGPFENIQNLYLYGSVTRHNRMCRKFGNCWLEYGNPLDSMDYPSTMEIGLYWYSKRTNKWTYNLSDHLMVDLEAIIALAYVIYTAHLDAYELRPNDKKVFNDFMDECLIDIQVHSRGGHSIVNLNTTCGGKKSNFW